MGKINADFLLQIKSTLTIQMSQVPMNLTYAQALQAFRNAVNLKFPPQFTAATRTTSQVQQGYTNNGGRGRGRFGRGQQGCGRQGRGGRGRGRGDQRRQMIGSTWITLRNRQQVEYHPFIRYPRHIFQQLKQEDFQQLMRD